MSSYSWIQELLQGPLPGVSAHREFVPDLPDAAARLQRAPDGARQSAVLVPLLQRDDGDLDVLFTVRSGRLRSHSGQISFPGGRVDEGEDAVATALREMEEETGVRESSVHILGALSPLWVPPSNSAIAPVVGMVERPQSFAPSEHEVQEIFTVSLATLMDQSMIFSEPWNLHDRTVEVRHWRVHPSVPLWGATAMILNELLWLIRNHDT